MAPRTEAPQREPKEQRQGKAKTNDERVAFLRLARAVDQSASSPLPLPLGHPPALTGNAAASNKNSVKKRDKTKTKTNKTKQKLGTRSTDERHANDMQMSRWRPSLCHADDMQMRYKSADVDRVLISDRAAARRGRRRRDMQTRCK